MIIKEPIGHSLFLFRDSGGYAPNLLISSHGAFTLKQHNLQKYSRKLPTVGGMTKVPTWTELVFYGPHEQVLTTLPMDVFFHGKTYPYETLKSSQIFKASCTLCLNLQYINLRSHSDNN